LTIVTFK